MKGEERSVVMLLQGEVFPKNEMMCEYEGFWGFQSGFLFHSSRAAALPAGFGLRNLKREFLNHCEVLSQTWFFYMESMNIVYFKMLSIVLGLFLTIKHAWQGLKTNAF